jgi:ABC-type branched-subunit amino acid transport system substrate-binding protein
MRTQLRRVTSLLVAALIMSAVFMGSCGSTKEEAGNGQGATPGDTTGVTDTEITLGTLMPLSGSPTAAWGIEISEGMQAYFDYINQQGGLYGRKIKLVVGDSQYSGPVAAEAIRKLVEEDNIFALVADLGTEPEAAIYQYLQDRGVPDLYVLSGVSKFTEPVGKNRFTAMVDYRTEGRIFATYLKDNFDGKKLGILAQNDDYGKEGEEGTRAGLKEFGANMDVTTEYYDVAQSDVTAQVQRLKADNAEVIMFWGSPVQAANMMKTVRQTLSWDVPMLINEANALDVTAQLAGNDNIEGVVSTTIGRQAWETDVQGVRDRKAIMAQVAPDLPFDNSTLVGYTIAEGMAGLLKQAGKDLTREALIAASESICNFATDLSLLPASTSPTDHRFLETEVFVKATVDRSGPSPVFRWQIFGDPIGFESTTSCTVPTPPPGGVDQPGPPLGGEKK